MKRNMQTAWAIVGHRGWINHSTIRYVRKDVIQHMIAEHRSYSNPKFNGTGLTDAQFWRRLKQRRGWTVRRISMKVVP